MKYLTLLFFGIIAWFLVDEFVLRDRSDQGLDTYQDKVKDLRKRLHWVFGALAALIILYFLIRLGYRALQPDEVPAILLF